MNRLFRRMVSNVTSREEDSTNTWTIPNSPVPYPLNFGKSDVDEKNKPKELMPVFCKPALATLNEKAEILEWTVEEKDHYQKFEYFFQLPSELQLYVLQFISSGDLYSIQLSCKALQALAKENILWKYWTSSHLGIPMENLHRFGREVRDQWAEHYKLQQMLYNKGEFVAEKMTSVENRPKVRFAQTGSVVDNMIYYIGGQMADKRSDEVLAFNPAAISFQKVDISNYDPERTLTQAKEEISGDCKNFKGIEGKIPSFARHQAVSINGKIYVFGGYDYTYFYNLAVFDPIKKTWKYPEVYGDIPAPRSNHSSAVVGNKFYIFGGSVGDNVDKYCVTNDFYCFDTITMTWSRVICKDGKEPSSRVGHVMTSLGQYVYMFGGGVWGKTTGWTEQYNDLHIFDTEESCWELVALKNEDKPQVCTYPYVCTFGQNVVLFGGASVIGSTVTNKLYLWDTIGRKWRELTLGGNEVSARSIGTANKVGDEIVVWGGYCGGLLEQENDLFKFKLQLKENKIPAQNSKGAS